jgi:hypothetical protein
MRDGGPKDNSDAGYKNEFTVKSYKSKGARHDEKAHHGGMTTVTRGHPANRAAGNYKKGARWPHPFDTIA